jgi:hypothetical protein
LSIVIPLNCVVFNVIGISIGDGVVIPPTVYFPPTPKTPFCDKISLYFFISPSSLFVAFNFDSPVDCLNKKTF